MEAGKVGPNGEPVCTRPRCRRMKDLNKNQLCGGHACPVPACKLSKSSTEKICETCAAARAVPLPKAWICLELETGVPVYLDFKNFVAQYNHPGSKGETARPRSSRRKPERPRKGFPLLFWYDPISFFVCVCCPRSDLDFVPTKVQVRGGNILILYVCRQLAGSLIARETEVGWMRQ
jgi:hypothetical protein